MGVRGWWLGGVGSLVFAVTAVAQPLTCDSFRDRLNGGMMVSSDRTPDVPAFVPKPNGSDGEKRFGWTMSNLSGTLTCNAADHFEEFYVTVELAQKDKFVEQLKQVVALNGAAICALAAESPAGCVEAGKLLLQDALQQLGSGYKRRVANPNGTSDSMLLPGVKAELTAATSLITFSLAVGAGATLDETRQPLTWPNPKTAQ